jgi:hypothetical protein
MSINTTPRGSGWVDDLQSHPQGEFRGETKLVKITEDVREFADEQKISEHEALQVGLEQKAKEFKQSGAEVYANA